MTENGIEDEDMKRMSKKQNRFMKKFINGLYEKNELKIIDAVEDVIHLSVLRNNQTNLIEAYQMLAYIYEQFNHPNKAFCIY